MALALFQSRVYVNDQVRYSSGTNDASLAQQRVRTNLLRIGPGAIGRVLQVLSQSYVNGAWTITKSIIVYEARVIHSGTSGTPAIVEEDHTTPPPVPPPTHTEPAHTEPAPAPTHTEIHHA